MAEPEGCNGPVMSLINKRMRTLRKKLKRISELEESVSQGKPIHKQQEELVTSKVFVSVALEELEKLRQPLAVAVAEEINLAVQCCKRVESKNLDVENGEEKQNEKKKKKKNKKTSGIAIGQVEVACPAA